MEKPDIKVGDHVMFTSALAHEKIPRWYPTPGTVGKVTAVNKDVCKVQWPDGTTSGKDNWFAPREVLMLQADPESDKEGSIQDAKS